MRTCAAAIDDHRCCYRRVVVLPMIKGDVAQRGHLFNDPRLGGLYVPTANAFHEKLSSSLLRRGCVFARSAQLEMRLSTKALISGDMP
jgi:hypothetical protein